ncbi:DUF6761 family protein [Candidatus Cyanaurora vandensis]|uniref:DUF6761 family protein n=1 Tax=Candidatus Cyanaurora vandensis TaxID=2714958 RepID=UPI00257EF3EE|nr:DUF6761 family protein [Candidatus Cyanaurora vandensis]
MLQDPQTIRHYQRLTDNLAELFYRGYRSEELRLFCNGYITALRHSQILESYEVNRLEQEIERCVRDPESLVPEPLAIPELEY